MRIPILFTIPNFITAGSGRAMLNIVERLDRKKFAPAVCVMRKGGDLDREVERLGIPFIEAPFSVPARPYHTLLVRAWRAAQVFRPYRFVIWHSFHYSDDYTEAIVARLAGAKAWVYTKKNMNWHRRSWYIRTLLATRIVAQNTDMVWDFFSARWFRNKVRLIPRGVDVERFHPSVPPRLRLREKLGIPSQVPVIATVAHLVPVKGHPTLIEAMVQVPMAHLWIAGKPLDKQYATSLKQMACDLGISERVHFLGGVDDIPALLSEVDIFVLPTWAKWRMEGCPVALLEAMACGKACIATDVPGSRDLIENGHSGVLVPPEDSKAMAEAIQYLISSKDLRIQMGQAARKRVEEHFSIEKEVAAHEALYMEILASLRDS